MSGWVAHVAGRLGRAENGQGSGKNKWEGWENEWGCEGFDTEESEMVREIGREKGWGRKMGGLEEWVWWEREWGRLYMLQGGV